MNVPRHLMKQTATILVPTPSTNTDGSPKTIYTASAAPTAKCSFQPGTSSNSLQLQREMGVTTYDVYMDPVLSSGAATTSALNHASRVTIGGVTYRMIGEPLNLCSEDAVLHCIMQRDT